VDKEKVRALAVVAKDKERDKVLAEAGIAKREKGQVKT